MRVWSNTGQGVPSRLPPATGDYTGWDWHTFYMAIVTALQHPQSQFHYVQSLTAVSNLPAVMVFTEPILAAAWARFAQMFPYWDLQAAWKYMETFTRETERLQAGDDRDWWIIEQDWQALERDQPYELIPFIEPGGYTQIGSLGPMRGRVVGI
jgi:hypothetical protein